MYEKVYYKKKKKKAYEAFEYPLQNFFIFNSFDKSCCGAMNFSNMEHKGTDPHDSPLKKDIDKIRNPVLISHPPFCEGRMIKELLFCLL